MDIRSIEKNEIKKALNLALDTFMEFEAPVYGEEGVKSFIADIIENKDFIGACENREALMYGAFIEDEIVGLIATRTSKIHISLVFVKKEYHHKGIATKLMDYAINDIVNTTGAQYITLNSSPYGILFYLNYGFVKLDNEKTMNGITYTPMVYIVDDELKLVFPTKKYQEELALVRKEFIENNDDDGLGSFLRYDKYEDWMSHINYLSNKSNFKPTDGYVEASQYILVKKNSNRIIGLTNIRHSLNEICLHTGGNIGYAIRPSERRKGYGSKILGFALILCKLRDMKKALVTCLKDNSYSEKIILKNGGLLENEEYSEREKNILKRYWINL